MIVHVGDMNCTQFSGNNECQASLNVFVLLVPAGPEHPPDDDDGAEGDGHEGLGRPEGAPQSAEGGQSALGPASTKCQSHIEHLTMKTEFQI